MSLLDVPVALWQSLLCKWVLLPDVIRFDFAVGSNKSAAANHLPLLLHDIQVSFCDNGKGNCKHLEKLSLWMKQRKVYFNHMEISAYSATDHQWAQIFEWTGGQVRSLSILAAVVDHICSNTTNVLTFASLFCKNLEEMLLNFVTASTEQINAILRNNVSTLKLLYLENFQIRASYISFNIPVLPITDLRLHGCPIKEIVPILRKCPQVTSLFVGGFNIDTVVAQCIALHSKQLKKLTLKNLLNVGAGVLLLIAQGCPEIQLLILMDCSIGNDIGEVVRILSKLQKLVLGSTLDIAELHTIESQSLRAVELVCRSLSVPKFQQFSQGCPNLAVLILNNIDFVEGEDVSSVLKNCPNLQYLQMTGVSGDMQNEVLKSAAMYCPILRTLNVSDSDDCAPEAIDHVLRSCIHIHNLMLIDAEENCAENGGYRIADPVISARVAVTRETPLCLGSLNHPSNKF